VFRSLKDLLCGQTFENDWFEQLDEKFFVDGVKARLDYGNATLAGLPAFQHR